MRLADAPQRAQALCGRALWHALTFTFSEQLSRRCITYVLPLMVSCFSLMYACGPYPICGLGRRMLACSVSQALLQGLRRMDVLSQVLSIRHNKLTACHGFCHSLNFLQLTDYCKAYIRPAQSIHYRRPVGHPEI